MSSLRFRGRGRRQQTVLLVALGALTGIAVAIALSDRDGRTGRRRNRGAQPALVDDAPDEPAEEFAEEFADEPGEDFEFAGDAVEPPDPAVRLAPGDEELESRVLEAFRNDPTLRGRAIDIGAIGDGIIELTGWVHSAAEVGHAITLARGVPDVAHVMDSLTIRAETRTRRPSANE